VTAADAAPPWSAAAVDDLLGQDAWDPPREWGTILVNFPSQDQLWLLPARSWHSDYGWTLTRSRCPGSRSSPSSPRSALVAAAPWSLPGRIVWWPGSPPRPRPADGVAGLADAVVLSCEAGDAKPDRRIFELALARLGAEPGSSLFIDDTPSHVTAAQPLGIAGHVHTGTRTTEAAIESLAGAA